MITLLTTGAGGGIGQGVIKAARLINDLDIRILAADMSPRSAGLYMADEGFLVPAFSHPDYYARLCDILREQKVDYYIPGTDLELAWCAEMREKIHADTQCEVIVSPLAAIQIADDKFKTYQFIKDCGLPHPRTVTRVDEFDNHYPVIVKPRVGCRAIGVHRVDDRATLLQLTDDRNDYVIQEYLGDDTQEYTCTIVACAGKYSDVAILQRELRAGDTYRARPVDNPAIARLVTQLARELKIEGSCNFQLRLVDGVPKCFEINCRFSGTTPFCALLGFNPVSYYLHQKLGLPYQSQLNYQQEVIRHWQEMVIHSDAAAQKLVAAG